MIKTKKSAQEMQDEIFRKMSAGEKLVLAGCLSRMVKELAGNKITPYETRRKCKFFD